MVGFHADLLVSTNSENTQELRLRTQFIEDIYIFSRLGRACASTTLLSAYRKHWNIGDKSVSCNEKNRPNHKRPVLCINSTTE